MTDVHFEVQITGPAALDIAEILGWSVQEFGNAAGQRYQALLTQALRDLGENPLRPGVKARIGLLPGAYTYHLASSRDRVAVAR
jgi:toxin ParE1/3/4